MRSSYVLGISAFYHDSAACLLCDGEIVAAAQEERFSRIKGDEAFPRRAIEYCLGSRGISPLGLTAVAFYEKPLLKFERLLETYVAIAPAGFASFRKSAPLWMKERLYMERAIRKGLGDYAGLLLFAEHHESHAASAFFPSPFNAAAILTIDGVGEWATGTIGRGENNVIEILREMRWPDSLGLLYSAFTYHAGFKVNSGEYKVMGLAPYGQPRFVQKILDNIVDLRADGSFTLDQQYFNYMGGLTMTSPAFDALFEGEPRRPESPLTQREKDLARSIQDVCEEIVLRMARTAHSITGLDSLCMAGGVALNAVTNGRVVREGPFKHCWIQPAAGDAGGALGAALSAWHGEFANSRVSSATDSMKRSLLGPAFSSDECADRLTRLGGRFERVGEEDLLERVASLIAEGNVIGWFQGRMEFGPRALGARSILADARNSQMQSQLNLKIKFREGFRPFAPSVLRDRANEYFDMEDESPYMLLVSHVRDAHRLPVAGFQSEGNGTECINRPRSDIPAVTHLDYSARVQTVTEENGRFHALLRKFEALTGCPLLINTSFNVRGEPIVCTPEDAYRCFMRTNLDYLVTEDLLFSKRDQQPFVETTEWQKGIELD